MEKPILDALYEASSGGKAYLGYVTTINYNDMMDTPHVTVWQPAPSTLAEAQAWADAESTLERTPHGHMLRSRGVVSIIVNLESFKTVHDQEWSPVRN